MTSDIQLPTRTPPGDDDIIPEKAEVAKSPSSTRDRLWSFLKIVLQFLGALQILIGLINTSLWMKWVSWMSVKQLERGHLEIFASGYALWGGLSFTISGIFTLISTKIFSKVLVKCCLAASILSAFAALAGIIIIHFNMIANHRCQWYDADPSCYRNTVTITSFILGKLTMATMEFCISTFLIALSAFQIKVPEDKSISISMENPYEDLLFQPDPYDEIQPEQEGYEQCNP
ncbi:high affinity immunoglobulin epsilon receptor subunit beta-like [Dromiciops gliroides]|uniref:high affinity immunoglobulin epsilon receptor subunit beta-like n=1 Tax=Dromiciops gliroides TaxID=33562 RepID=UPI001CC70A48|nr:high affinity immunoglobulin epsilon receptor subunit beta-like [Dromiciops gliroides]